MTLIWIIPLLALQIWACTLPMFGHFGSYQAVNAMMAELFGQQGVSSFFEPRIFTVVGGEPGLCLLYFPYSAWLARITQIIFRLDVDFLPFLGKSYSLIAYLSAAIFFRRILSVFIPERDAVNLGVIFFLAAPMLAVSAISFQNEAWAICFTLMSFNFLLQLREEGGLRQLFLSGAFLAAAATARIHFLSMLIPVFFILFDRKSLVFKNALIFITGFGVVFLAWLGWFYFLQTSYPEAVYTSLFTQSGEGRFLIRKLFFSPDFYLRVGKQILLFFVFPLIWCFILFNPLMKDKRVAWAWLLSSLIVILLLPRKVIDHPFYLIGGIPPLILLVVQGFSSAVTGKYRMLWVRGLSLFAIAYVCFVVFRFQGLPIETNEWLNQAKWMRENILPDKKVVLQHDQATAMLFYSHRKGWNFNVNMSSELGILASTQERYVQRRKKGYGDPVAWLEYLRSQGADFLVITDRDQYKKSKVFYKYISSSYPVISKEGDPVILIALEK